MLQMVKSDTDLFQLAEAMEFGEIHLGVDTKTGMRAVIAIHNTNLGPALGGCRCISYETTDAAVLDAMRLAEGMTYKAAISGVPHGGGKSVLMKPAVIQDREAYFESFGKFVDSLGGRYITAVDSGSTVSDMDVIARRTKHVVSTSGDMGGKGNPSPFTALGVLQGIKAAVKHKLKSDDLDGIHVAIQGAGNVAYFLAQSLSKLGARITICDNKDQAAQRFADEFKAEVVAKETIFDVECDVFAPCARGAILTETTVERLKTGIVAGAANNQLAQADVAALLFNKQILYAPDYVINAGGLIHVSIDDLSVIEDKVKHIYDTLLNIFQRSETQQQPTDDVAHSIASELLHQGNQ